MKGIEPGVYLIEKGTSEHYTRRQFGKTRWNKSFDPNWGEGDSNPRMVLTDASNSPIIEASSDRRGLVRYECDKRAKRVASFYNVRAARLSFKFNELVRLRSVFGLRESKIHLMVEYLGDNLGEYSTREDEGYVRYEINGRVISLEKRRGLFVIQTPIKLPTDFELASIEDIRTGKPLEDLVKPAQTTEEFNSYVYGAFIRMYKPFDPILFHGE